MPKLTIPDHEVSKHQENNQYKDKKNKEIKQKSHALCTPLSKTS